MATNVTHGETKKKAKSGAPRVDRNKPENWTEERLRATLADAKRRTTESHKAFGVAYVECVRRGFAWADEYLAHRSLAPFYIAIGKGEIIPEAFDFLLGASKGMLEEFKKLNAKTQAKIFIDDMPITIVRDGVVRTIEHRDVTLSVEECRAAFDPRTGGIRSPMAQKEFIATEMHTPSQGNSHSSTGGVRAYVRVGMTVEEEQRITAAAHASGTDKYKFILKAALGEATRVLKKN